jgi:hypothetical protein
MESRRSRGRRRAALAMLAIVAAAVALVLVAAEKVHSNGLVAAFEVAGPDPPALRLQLAESERLLYRAQLCSKTNGGETTRYRGVWDCIAR